MDLSASHGNGGEDSIFITDKTSTDFNAEDKAQKLLNDLDNRAKVYQADDLFVVFGDDFKYKNAHWYYE